MKETWLIRHAESTANIGEVTATPREIPLSEKGFQQARQFSESVGVRPDLVIVSPYLRAQQTAEPFLNRFSDTAHETWLVQEFTYLSIERCRNTNSQGRRPMVEEYWNRQDPIFSDGGQAESLVEFFGRIENFLRKIRETPYELAFVFTHEQVIKALIWAFLHPDKVFDAKFMSDFHKFLTSFVIPNTAFLKLNLSGDNEFFIGQVETGHIQKYA